MRIQVWTALCAHLLVAIAKREYALPGSLYQILQIISISALEKVPLPELFTHFDNNDAAYIKEVALFEMNSFSE